MKHQHELRAEGYCTIEGNLTLGGTQRGRMRNAYTCVCVLNYQSRGICKKCQQDARSKRAKQALLINYMEHVCDITVWNYEL